MFDTQRKMRAIRKKYSVSSMMNMDAISGLPLPSGTMIYVLNPPDSIVMWRDADNQEWVLDKSKITGVSLVKGSALQINDGLNKDGALGGLILGGLPGAVLGLFIPNDNYLVISYTSGGEDKTIILKVPAAGIPLAKRIIKECGGESSAGANTVNTL